MRSKVDRRPPRGEPGDGNGSAPKPPAKPTVTRLTIRVRFYSAKKGSGKRLRTRKRWLAAIEWWIRRINANCKGQLEILPVTDLGDDRTRLNRVVKKREFPLLFFASEARYAKNEGTKNQRLIGLRDLCKTLQVPGENANAIFHIGLFKRVLDKPVGGKTGSIPGLWPVGTNVIAVKATTDSKSARLHEMGHLFGLLDDDGGVMDKNFAKGKPNYGSTKVFKKRWCPQIAAHLGAKSKDCARL